MQVNMAVQSALGIKGLMLLLGFDQDQIHVFHESGSVKVLLTTKPLIDNLDTGSQLADPDSSLLVVVDAPDIKIGNFLMEWNTATHIWNHMEKNDQLDHIRNNLNGRSPRELIEAIKSKGITIPLESFVLG